MNEEVLRNSTARITGYKATEVDGLTPEEIKGDKPQIALSAAYPDDDMCFATATN